MSISNTGMGVALARAGVKLGNAIAGGGGLHNDLAKMALGHHIDTEAAVRNAAIDMAKNRQSSELEEQKANNDHNRTINRSRAESLIRQQELDYAIKNGQPNTKVQHGNLSFTSRDYPTSGAGVKITATPAQLAAAVRAHVNLTRRKNASPNSIQRSRDSLVALHGYDFKMADKAVNDHIKANPIQPPRPRPVP